MQTVLNHTDSDKPLLSTTQLSCVRGENTLFDNLSLSVYPGQCLHVIGTNGSGKTSLLRILSGINRAENGTVFWRSEPYHVSDSFSSETAFVGHKDGLKNELTAFENLAFQQRLEQTLDEDKLDDVLLKLKILKCADLAAQVLSFGQRRRLAFAKLILVYKPLWILDEPFTGIDAAGRNIIEELCLEHLKNGGSIVLTHHQRLQNSLLKNHTQELHLEKYSIETESSINLGQA